MATREVVLQGAVTPEGRLVLDQDPGLPAGRVQVIVRPADEAALSSVLLDVLRPIWERLDAQGFSGGRTLEEAVADVRAMRDEWAAHDQRLEEFRDRRVGAACVRRHPDRPGDPRVV
jgi:hypothetical protein